MAVYGTLQISIVLPDVKTIKEAQEKLNDYNNRRIFMFATDLNDETIFFDTKTRTVNYLSIDWEVEHNDEDDEGDC